MTPRSFLAVALAGVVVLAAACTGSAGRGAVDDPLRTPIDSAASIDAAASYLHDHAGEVSPLIAPIVDYLHRKYPGSVPVPSLDRLRAAAADPETDEAIYIRLVDPDAQITAARLAAEDDEVNVITAPALYCDRFEPPDDFDATLDTATATGEYQLTHAALADQWMLDLGCSSNAEIEDRRAAQSQGLVDLVEAAGADTDLGIEAVAMLLHTGRADRVSRAWIEAIVDAQRADGGWAKAPDDTVTSDHTTALALWALLEFANPDVERLSWPVAGP